MIYRKPLQTSFIFFVIFLLSSFASADDLGAIDCLSPEQQKEIYMRMVSIVNEPVDETRVPQLDAFRDRYKLAKAASVSAMEALTICQSTKQGDDRSKDAQCSAYIEKYKAAQANFEAIDAEAVNLGQRLLNPKFERIKALRAGYSTCVR